MSRTLHALVDALRDVAPRLHAVRARATEQQHDAEAALVAVRRALDLLAAAAVPITPRRSPTTLELAALRTGRTLTDVAFLSGIGIDRLLALAAGDAPTAAERLALASALPDWPTGAREGGAE